MMLPLSFFLGLWVAPFLGESWEDLRIGLSQPHILMVLGLVTVCMTLHAVLGLQVIIEDYLPRSWHRWGLRGVRVWGMALTLVLLRALSALVTIQGGLS